MKTAMQELIEYLRDNDYHIPIKVNLILEELLEKEKQRMFHCFNAGADRICDKEFNEWFDQTYNKDRLSIKTNGKVGLSNPDETINNKINLTNNL